MERYAISISLVKFKRKTMKISYFFISYNNGIHNETFHFQNKKKYKVIKLSLHNEIIAHLKTHPPLFT